MTTLKQNQKLSNLYKLENLPDTYKEFKKKKEKITNKPPRNLKPTALVTVIEPSGLFWW